MVADDFTGFGVSANFTIPPGAPASFVGLPATIEGVAGPFGPTIAGSVTDAYGNGVDATISVGLPGSVTGPASVVPTDGMFSIDVTSSVVGTHSVSLTVVGGVTANIDVVIRPGPVSTLTAVFNPINPVAGTLFDVTVEALDGVGNRVNANVTVIPSEPVGPAAQTAGEILYANPGPLVLTGFNMTVAGSQSIYVALTGGEPGGISAQNFAVTVLPGPGIRTATPAAPAAVSFVSPLTTLPAVDVCVQDAYGNGMDTDSTAVLSIGSSTTGGVLTGTPSCTILAASTCCTLDAATVDRVGLHTLDLAVTGGFPALPIDVEVQFSGNTSPTLPENAWGQLDFGGDYVGSGLTVDAGTCTTVNLTLDSGGLFSVAVGPQNYETTPSCSFQVSVGGGVYSMAVDVDISDANDAPILTPTMINLGVTRSVFAVPVTDEDDDAATTTTTIDIIPSVLVLRDGNGDAIEANGTTVDGITFDMESTFGFYIDSFWVSVDDGQGGTAGPVQIVADVAIDCPDPETQRLNNASVCVCNSASFLNLDGLCEKCPAGTWYTAEVTNNPCDDCPDCGYCAGGTEPIVPDDNCFALDDGSLVPCLIEDVRGCELVFAWMDWGRGRGWVRELNVRRAWSGPFFF